MKADTLIMLVDLPEKCSCGGEKGGIMKVNIEGPGGKLLAEVKCKGCGKRHLIPDSSSEKSREMMTETGREYPPTWYYDPRTDEIVPRR